VRKSGVSERNRWSNVSCVGVVTVVVTAMFLGFGAQAASAQPNISVSVPSVAAGGVLTISGNVPITGQSSCSAADAARLTATAALFPPDGFGPSVARDGAGDFHVDYVVPSATPPGAYTIGIRCGGGNVGISVALTVAIPVSTTTTTTTTAATTSTSAATTAPATTVAPSTVAPATALPPAAATESHSHKGWILVGVLVAVAVIVALVAGIGLGRRSRR
jgi:hypothetical protein